MKKQGKKKIFKTKKNDGLCIYSSTLNIQIFIYNTLK